MSHYVYRFYNKDNTIIYVGRTSDGIRKRMYSHFHNGHLSEQCYLEVHKIDYCKLPTKVETKIIEMYLINKHKPLYNTEDKEYKELSLSVDFQFEWKTHTFESKEIIKSNELQKTINGLRDEIKKVKEKKTELARESAWQRQRITELENTLSLKYEKPQIITSFNYVATDFRFTSDTIENIFLSDEFKDVSFVGEIKVNDQLIEKIVIKKENDITAYYFEVSQSAYTRELLLKNFLNKFAENNYLTLINCTGFIPLVQNQEVIHRMREYCENKEFYKVEQDLLAS